MAWHEKGWIVFWTTHNYFAPFQLRDKLATILEIYEKCSKNLFSHIIELWFENRVNWKEKIARPWSRNGHCPVLHSNALIYQDGLFLAIFFWFNIRVLLPHPYKSTQPCSKTHALLASGEETNLHPSGIQSSARNSRLTDWIRNKRTP